MEIAGKNKVTIVTVCFNAAKEIENTILSVVSQDYAGIEYLVVDGGSTDGTVEIIKRYGDRISFWSSEPDHGIYDAMNKAIRRATGEWINFMNAGDCFVDSHVVSKVFGNVFDEKTGGIYGDTIFKRGRLYKYNRETPFWEAESYLHGMGFCHQSTFVRTELAKKFPFDIAYKVAADYKMIKSIYDAGYTYLSLPYPISIFDCSEGYSGAHHYTDWSEKAKINGVYATPKFYLICAKRKLRQFLERNFPALAPRRKDAESWSEKMPTSLQ